MKSIRLTEGLGDKDYDVSGLNVLHLVRDPRPVVVSQKEHLRTTWNVHQAKTDYRETLRAGGARCDVKVVSAYDNPCK